MMLLLTVFYSIPEFDVSNFFLMNCSSDKLNGIGNVSSLNEGGASGVLAGASAPQDSERIRLKAPGTSGPRYTQQINETNELGVSFCILKICIEMNFHFCYSILGQLLEPDLDQEMTILQLKKHLHQEPQDVPDYVEIHIIEEILTTYTYPDTDRKLSVFCVQNIGLLLLNEVPHLK